MRLIKKYPLASFFALALLITWSFQIPAVLLAPRYGMVLNNEANLLHFVDLLRLRLPPGQAMVYSLFMLGAGPLLAAVFVTWATEGTAGLRALWQQCIRWKIGGRWYLVAFVLPLVISAVSVGIGVLASGGRLDYTPKLPLAYFLPFFLYMVIFTGVYEEPGWRGFALPRLQRRYSAYASSWILGVLWGAWHFHFQIYYAYALGIIPLLVSLIILALGTVGWTIVLTWLYNSTTSVWLIILLHGWGNTIQSYVVLSSNNLPAQAIYGFVPWVIAIVLLWVYGRQNLARYARPQAGPDHHTESSTGDRLVMAKERV